MRLLFVVHQFLPEYSAGTELVALNLAQAAQRAGHRADVLTRSMDAGAGWHDRSPEGFREAAVRGLSVSGIVDRPGRDAYGFDRKAGGPGCTGPDDDAIDRFLHRGDYDLVHVMHAMRMLDVVGRLRALQIPYLLTLTDFFLLCYRINLLRLDSSYCTGPQHLASCTEFCAQGSIDRTALQQRHAMTEVALRDARLRVACSEFVADAFRIEHPNLDVRVIGHGIDLLRAHPRRPGGQAELAFGYVGTLSRAKGLDVLVRAFAGCEAPNARLDLIGPIAGDTRFEHELVALASLDRRIRLHGPLPPTEVPAALAALDVLCLPTRLPETFSLALHEGFAAGLPALVSDLGHPAMVVRAAECGEVLPPGDETAWRQAIEAIARDPTRLAPWRARLPLPARVEEEAFLYSQLYRACIA